MLTKQSFILSSSNIIVWSYCLLLSLPSSLPLSHIFLFLSLPLSIYLSISQPIPLSMPRSLPLIKSINQIDLSETSFYLNRKEKTFPPRGFSVEFKNRINASTKNVLPLFKFNVLRQFQVIFFPPPSQHETALTC